MEILITLINHINFLELTNLETFPGVLKIGNFTDFDDHFANFNFATLYLFQLRRYTGKSHWLNNVN